MASLSPASPPSLPVFPLLCVGAVSANWISFALLFFSFCSANTFICDIFCVFCFVRQIKFIGPKIR